MKRLLALALPLGIGAAAAAPAQNAAEPGQRIRQVIIYGNEACPPSSPNEIVVCARRNADEQFRIPRELREAPPDAADGSWAARAQSLEMVGRTGTQSCSTVGPGGFTGCWEQMMNQARQENRAAGTNAQVP